MPKLPFYLQDCKVFLLAKAYQKAHGELKKRLFPYRMTNMQNLVLEGLWYKKGVTATKLGKLLTLDKATLSVVLDRMEKDGWIVKRQSLEDRRLFLLYPTKKANRMKKKLVKARKEANEKLLEKLSQVEKILLGRMLRNLI